MFSWIIIFFAAPKKASKKKRLGTNGPVTTFDQMVAEARKYGVHVKDIPKYGVSGGPNNMMPRMNSDFNNPGNYPMHPGFRQNSYSNYGNNSSHPGNTSWQQQQQRMPGYDMPSWGQGQGQSMPQNAWTQMLNSPTNISNYGNTTFSQGMQGNYGNNIASGSSQELASPHSNISSPSGIPNSVMSQDPSVSRSQGVEISQSFQHSHEHLSARGIPSSQGNITSPQSLASPQEAASPHGMPSPRGNMTSLQTVTSNDAVSPQGISGYNGSLPSPHSSITSPHGSITSPHSNVHSPSTQLKGQSYMNSIHNRSSSADSQFTSSQPPYASPVSSDSSNSQWNFPNPSPSFENQGRGGVPLMYNQQHNKQQMISQNSSQGFNAEGHSYVGGSTGQMGRFDSGFMTPANQQMSMNRMPDSSRSSIHNISDSGMSSASQGESSFTSIQQRRTPLNPVQQIESGFNATKSRESSFSSVQHGDQSLNLSQQSNSSFNPRYQGDSSMNLSGQSESSFNQSYQGDSSLDLSRHSDSYFNPRHQGSSSLNLTGENDLSLNPGGQGDSSLNLSQQFDSSFNPRQQVNSSLNLSQQGEFSFNAGQQMGADMRTSHQIGSAFHAQQMGSDMGTTQQREFTFPSGLQRGSNFNTPQQGESSIGPGNQAASLFNMLQQKGSSFNQQQQKNYLNATQQKNTNFHVGQQRESLNAHQQRDTHFNQGQQRDPSLDLSHQSDPRQQRQTNFNTQQQRDVGFHQMQQDSCLNLTQQTNAGYDTVPPKEPIVSSAQNRESNSDQWTNPNFNPHQHNRHSLPQNNYKDQGAYSQQAQHRVPQQSTEEIPIECGQPQRIDTERRLNGTRLSTSSEYSDLGFQKQHTFVDGNSATIDSQLEYSSIGEKDNSSQFNSANMEENSSVLPLPVVSSSEGNSRSSSLINSLKEAFNFAGNHLRGIGTSQNVSQSSGFTGNQGNNTMCSSQAGQMYGQQSNQCSQLSQDYSGTGDDTSSGNLDSASYSNNCQNSAQGMPSQNFTQHGSNFPHQDVPYGYPQYGSGNYGNQSMEYNQSGGMYHQNAFNSNMNPSANLQTTGTGKPKKPRKPRKPREKKVKAPNGGTFSVQIPNSSSAVNVSSVQEKIKSAKAAGNKLLEKLLLSTEDEEALPRTVPNSSISHCSDISNGSLCSDKQNVPTSSDLPQHLHSLSSTALSSSSSIMGNTVSKSGEIHNFSQEGLSSESLFSPEKSGQYSAPSSSSNISPEKLSEVFTANALESGYRKKQSKQPGEKKRRGRPPKSSLISSLQNFVSSHKTQFGTKVRHIATGGRPYKGSAKNFNYSASSASNDGGFMTSTPHPQGKDPRVYLPDDDNLSPTYTSLDDSFNSGSKPTSIEELISQRNSELSPYFDQEQNAMFRYPSAMDETGQSVRLKTPMNRTSLVRSLSTPGPVVEKRKRGRPPKNPDQKSKPRARSVSTTSDSFDMDDFKMPKPRKTPKDKSGVGNKYSYVFHVPTHTYKKLKFIDMGRTRNQDIGFVRMHPMDARRYSLLKVGREIVRIPKLSKQHISMGKMGQTEDLQELLTMSGVDVAIKRKSSMIGHESEMNLLMKATEVEKWQQAAKVKSSNSVEKLVVQEKQRLSDIIPETEGYNIEKIDLSSIIDQCLKSNINVENDTLSEDNTSVITQGRNVTTVSDSKEENENASANPCNTTSAENERNHDGQSSPGQQKQRSEKSRQLSHDCESIEELIEKKARESQENKKSEPSADEPMDQETAAGIVTNKKKDAVCVAPVSHSGVLPSQGSSQFENQFLQYLKNQGMQSVGPQNAGPQKVRKERKPSIRSLRKQNKLKLHKKLPLVIDPDQEEEDEVILRDVSLLEASDGRLTPIRSRTPVTGRSPIRQNCNVDQYQLVGADILCSKDELENKTRPISDINSETASVASKTDNESRSSSRSNSECEATTQDLKKLDIDEPDSVDTVTKETESKGATSHESEKRNGASQESDKAHDTSQESDKTNHMSQESDKKNDTSQESDKKNDTSHDRDKMLNDCVNDSEKMKTLNDCVNDSGKMDIDSAGVNDSGKLDVDSASCKNSCKNETNLLQVSVTHDNSLNTDKLHSKAVLSQNENTSYLGDTMEMHEVMDTSDTIHKVLHRDVERLKSRSRSRSPSVGKESLSTAAKEGDVRSLRSRSRSSSVSSTCSNRRSSRRGSGDASVSDNDSVCSSSGVRQKRKRRKLVPGVDFVVTGKFRGHKRMAVKLTKVDVGNTSTFTGRIVFSCGVGERSDPFSFGKPVCGNLFDRFSARDGCTSVNSESLVDFASFDQTKNRLSLSKSKLICDEVIEISSSDDSNLGTACVTTKVAQKVKRNVHRKTTDPDWSASESELTNDLGYSNSDSCGEKAKLQSAKKKKVLTKNQRLHSAFSGASYRSRKKKSPAQSGKTKASLSILHQATIAKLHENKDSYGNCLDDYKTVYEDAMYKMSLLSPQTSDAGSMSPPQPSSPGEVIGDISSSTRSTSEVLSPVISTTTNSSPVSNTSVSDMSPIYPPTMTNCNGHVTLTVDESPAKATSQGVTPERNTAKRNILSSDKIQTTSAEDTAKRKISVQEEIQTTSVEDMSVSVENENENAADFGKILAENENTTDFDEKVRAVNENTIDLDVKNAANNDQVNSTDEEMDKEEIRLHLSASDSEGSDYDDVIQPSPETTDDLVKTKFNTTKNCLSVNKCNLSSTNNGHVTFNDQKTKAVSPNKRRIGPLHSKCQAVVKIKPLTLSDIEKYAAGGPECGKNDGKENYPEACEDISDEVQTDIKRKSIKTNLCDGEKCEQNLVMHEGSAKSSVVSCKRTAAVENLNMSSEDACLSDTGKKSKTEESSAEKKMESVNNLKNSNNPGAPPSPKGKATGLTLARGKQRLVYMPSRPPPTQESVENSAVSYGLKVTDNKDAFFSNPEDAPERPR